MLPQNHDREFAVTCEISKFEQSPQSARLSYARAELGRVRARSAAFPKLRLCAPVWTMLLDVYVSECDEASLDISGLASGSGAPFSTAMRYVDQMLKHEVLRRRYDPADRRRSLVRMTAETRRRLDLLIDRELALGSPPFNDRRDIGLLRDLNRSHVGVNVDAAGDTTVRSSDR